MSDKELPDPILNRDDFNIDLGQRTLQARRIVYDYVARQRSTAERHPSFGLDEVHIVWFCKTLQNWKAIVMTTLPDSMIYEVTYNGDKGEAYLDVYRKLDNVLVRD